MRLVADASSAPHPTVIALCSLVTVRLSHSNHLQAVRECARDTRVVLREVPIGPLRTEVADLLLKKVCDRAEELPETADALLRTFVRALRTSKDATREAQRDLVDRVFKCLTAACTEPTTVDALYQVSRHLRNLWLSLSCELTHQAKHRAAAMVYDAASTCARDAAEEQYQRLTSRLCGWNADLPHYLPMSLQ